MTQTRETHWTSLRFPVCKVALLVLVYRLFRLTYVGKHLNIFYLTRSKQYRNNMNPIRQQAQVWILLSKFKTIAQKSLPFCHRCANQNWLVSANMLQLWYNRIQMQNCKYKKWMSKDRNIFYLATQGAAPQTNTIMQNMECYFKEIGLIIEEESCGNIMNY